MEDKKLFLIGEVAKMFHISMGTLRHYEQAGLLTPEYTDPDTGYRYYGTRQFELLNTIRYLRVLDFPLAQIKAFLDNRDTDVIEEKLVHQKEVIARKQKELELIQYYITIQKYRFEDRLNFQTDIPQNLLSCYVLKLTLQPLVENTIRYGLEENTEGCLISISAEACPEKDQLIIYVKNDGSAFEDDLLSKLENRQIEPHGFGIGLLNIQKRMQITYGEAYGLTLYNEEELAVAKLVYPLKPVILSPDAEASLTV